MSRTLGSGTHGTRGTKLLYYPKGSYYQGLNLEYMTSCDIEVNHLVHINKKKNKQGQSRAKLKDWLSYPLTLTLTLQKTNHSVNQLSLSIAIPCYAVGFRGSYFTRDSPKRGFNSIR